MPATGAHAPGRRARTHRTVPARDASPRPGARVPCLCGGSRPAASATPSRRSCRAGTRCAAPHRTPVADLPRTGLATEPPGGGTVRGASPHPPATGLRRTIPACGASPQPDAGPARHRPGPAAPHLTPMPGPHDTAPTPDPRRLAAPRHPGAPMPLCPCAPVPRCPCAGSTRWGPGTGAPAAASLRSCPARFRPGRAASVPVPGRLRPGPGAGAGPDAVAGGKPRRSVREDRARGAIPRGRRPGCRPPSPAGRRPGFRPAGANLDMPAHTDRVIVGMSAARPGYPAPARRPSEGTDDDDEWFRRPGG